MSPFLLTAFGLQTGCGAALQQPARLSGLFQDPGCSTNFRIVPQAQASLQTCSLGCHNASRLFA
jgi:hypothetical protein